jgi:hypothetical protein
MGNIFFQSQENWDKIKENILSNAKIGIILYKYICPEFRPEFCRIFQDFINKYLMKSKLY